VILISYIHHHNHLSVSDFMFMVFFNRFKTVFGSKLEQQPSGLGDQNGVLRITTGLEIDEKLYEDECKNSSVQVIFCAYNSQMKLSDSNYRISLLM